MVFYNCYGIVLTLVWIIIVLYFKPLLFTDGLVVTGPYCGYVTSNPLPNTPTHEVILHNALGDKQVTYLGAFTIARSMGASMFEVFPSWLILTLLPPHHHVNGWCILIS
jgi:hypothetical protein